MTTYTEHADEIFDPNRPILGSTHLEARDNLIAVAEGGLGAPKIASKTIGGKTTSGSPLNIASLNAFSGIWIWGVIKPSGSATVTAELSSDSGSSYATPTTVMTIGAGAKGSFNMFVNLVTGGWKSVYDDGTIVQYGSGTLAGGGAGVTDFRLDPANADLAILANPQGGESAS